MTKKFKLTALIVALVMACSIIPFNTAYADDILPDISGLFMPEPLGNTSDDQSLPQLVTEFNPQSGIPGQFDIKKGENQPKTEMKGFSPFGTEAQIGSVRSIYDPTESINKSFILSAKGTYCNVYVDNNTTTTPASAYMKPSGQTPNQKAADIAAEFDAYIYSQMRDIFGEPLYMPSTEGKINIMMYDIFGDGSASSSQGFVAGFFYGNDLISGACNDDTILYMDLGMNHGYAMAASQNMQNRVHYYGIIAHEFQHLINFSQIVSLWGDIDDIDPDLGKELGIALWLNEGLSGLANNLYIASRGYAFYEGSGQISSFFKNDLAPGVGYVPFTYKWRETENTDKIYANYGAAALLMQEYYDYIGDVMNLMGSDKWGYYHSLREVGGNFFDSDIDYSDYNFDDFNNFFSRAMLDIMVDSPAFTDSQIPCYNTPGIDNTWSYRQAYSITVPKLNASTSVTSGGREYYSNVYLADSVGSNIYVTINVPANTKAKYYIITPYNATNIDSRARWNSAAKMAGQLAPGKNELVVGSNNMFALLAVNFKDSVNDTVTYSNSVTSPPLSAPKNVKAAAGNKSVKITFDKPDTGTADYYKVMSTDGSISQTVTNTSCIITGLENGTSYRFTVRACNAYRESTGVLTDYVTPVAAAVNIGNASPGNVASNTTVKNTPGTVSSLKVAGRLNSSDITAITALFGLENLDLSGITSGMGAIDTSDMKQLKSLILPPSSTGEHINAALSGGGKLCYIDVPASLLDLASISGKGDLALRLTGSSVASVSGSVTGTNIWAVYVPSNLVAEYRSHSFWGNFNILSDSAISRPFAVLGSGNYKFDIVMPTAAYGSQVQLLVAVYDVEGLLLGFKEVSTASGSDFYVKNVEISPSAYGKSSVKYKIYVFDSFNNLAPLSAIYSS